MIIDAINFVFNTYNRLSKKKKKKIEYKYAI